MEKLAWNALDHGYPGGIHTGHIQAEHTKLNPVNVHLCEQLASAVLYLYG